MEINCILWLGYFTLLTFNVSAETTTAKTNLPYESTSSNNGQIEAFDCVYLYSEKVYCQWLADTSCRSWNFTYSLLSGGMAFSPKSLYNCSDVNKTLCDVGSNASPPTRQRCEQTVENTDCYGSNYQCLDDFRSYEFQIRGACYNNETYSRTFIVPINETLVKMEAVENVIVFPESSTITVKWQFQKPPFYYNSEEVTCQIWYGSNGVFVHKMTTKCRDQHIEEKIAGVRPSTLYNIRIRCRPKDSVIWSDFKDLQVRSKSTVPLVGPKMTNSGFVMRTDVLLLYLKVPEGYLAQGNITHTRVALTDHATDKTLITVTNRTETVPINLCWSGGISGYTVEAAVKNQVGWSLNSTEIIIHHNTDLDLIQPDNIIVEIDKETGLSRISLYNMDRKIYGNFTYFTYFWCIGTDEGSEGVICLDKTEWIHSTSYSITVDIGSGDMEKSEFGVALAFEQYSSGVVWASCIFKQTIKEMQAKKPTILNMGDGSVAVMIPRAFCLPQGYRPLYYILKYKRQQDKTWNNQMVQASIYSSNFTLRNTSIDTIYDMVFYTQYRYGRGPLVEFTFSAAGKGVLKSQGDSITYLSILATVFVIAIIGLVFGCRTCVKERLNKLKKWFAPDEIDKVPVEVGNTSTTLLTCIKDPIEHKLHSGSVGCKNDFNPTPTDSSDQSFHSYNECSSTSGETNNGQSQETDDVQTSSYSQTPYLDLEGNDLECNGVSTYGTKTKHDRTNYLVNHGHEWSSGQTDEVTYHSWNRIDSIQISPKDCGDNMKLENSRIITRENSLVQRHCSSNTTQEVSPVSSYVHVDESCIPIPAANEETRIERRDEMTGVGSSEAPTVTYHSWNRIGSIQISPKDCGDNMKLENSRILTRENSLVQRHCSSNTTQEVSPVSSYVHVDESCIPITAANEETRIERRDEMTGVGSSEAPTVDKNETTSDERNEYTTDNEIPSVDAYMTVEQLLAIPKSNNSI